METPFNIFITIGLLIVLCLPLNAAHIIGGEIIYECLGDGSTPNTKRYQFYMNVYRDCNGGGADFDSGPMGAFDATVTIYQGNSLYDSLILSNLTITNIDPSTTNPCLIVPPNICVEEGVYVFPVLELPVVTESYYIVYQRCCRNNTISNIYAPDDTGATFAMELTTEAQMLCNNSPTFNGFPPPVICAGEPLSFDHSAIDADGDQLVYEFCTPLRGGGTNSNNTAAFDGIAPHPDAPPPYNGVAYILPDFSPLAPLGEEAGLVIESNTGMLTGTPAQLGQYVVGVCVSEYRNGVLLSVLRRDFQFNVAVCEPTVVALIQADEEIDDKHFIINSCGNETISFVNESFQQNFINEFRWDFLINGTIQSFDEWNPTITFPGEGSYEGSLVLNPGFNCGDSASITVNVFPTISANFDYAYDTCIAGPVTFTDLSFSGTGAIEQWDWSFGDGNGDTIQNPQHLYQIPGDIPVTLTVTDINDCQAQSTQPISYFPVPALIIISPSSFLGCVPAEIFFDNLSVPIDETYDIVWDFGDGTTGNDISPLHTYTNTGVYDVSLDITSPIGCHTDTLFPALITVEPSPTAAFSFSPENPSNFDPLITFTDESQGAAEWFWNFDSLVQSFKQHPVYTFPDTGLHTVTLIVTHESGCQDTLTQKIDVTPQVRFFMPNAFTPNNDSKNDVFGGVGFFDGLANFSWTIWNRWGELVFESDNPAIPWNGRKNNVGKMSPTGVYVYSIQFDGPRRQSFEYKGFVTLLR